MLIELPRNTEIFGPVKIHELQRVLKFDSGPFQNSHASNIPFEEIKDVLKRLAVIIPIKDENIHLLDGVLRAIPFYCSVILVSNSQTNTPNTYKTELDTIENIHNLTHQEIIGIHQKDKKLANIFNTLGYNYILNKNCEEYSVRDGKSEAMIIGMLLAKSIKKDFVGFIDADNYIPGSVREYVIDFAAALCMSKTPYCMVRLHWRYKPKIIEEKLYFKKWGRVSEITNKYLNLLLSDHSGFETEAIQTGNAGEHAMTIKLANIMDYSTGFSIEPYHFISLFDKFGKKTEDKINEDAANTGIEIFQIETLNPHIHEEKGRKHIRKMLLGSLKTIYHSKLCNDNLKEKIIEEIKNIRKTKINKKPKQPKKNIIMPAIENIDTDKFIKMLEENPETFVRYKQNGFFS